MGHEMAGQDGSGIRRYFRNDSLVGNRRVDLPSQTVGLHQGEQGFVTSGNIDLHLRGKLHMSH